MSAIHSRPRPHVAHTEEAHAHEHVASSAGRVWLRVGVWLSLSVLALWILLGGHSALYIANNVRWTLWLAVVASLGMAALDGAAAWERGERPRLAIPIGRLNPGTALLFMPFAAGLAIPPAVLGAGSILAHDGVVALVGAPQPAASNPATALGAMSLVQLQHRAQRSALVVGEQVQVSGFVLHQAGLPAGAWLLVRFVTPHCVAEAQPVGLLIRPAASATSRSPPDNAWFTVSGQMAAASVAGKSVAALEGTELRAMSPPDDPYLIY